MSERVSVVFGDVHGDIKLLELLVKMVHDRYGSANVDWYSVGDLVDRGPDSKAVIDFCIHLGVQAVMGNHETWLHKYLETGEFDEFALHKAMGGKSTLESYGCMWTGKPKVEEHLGPAVPDSHKQFILSMPLWRKIPIGNRLYRLSHTGLDFPSYDIFCEQVYEASQRGVPVPLPKTEDFDDLIFDMIAEVQPAILLWAGNSVMRPNLAQLKDGSHQVFGHTPAGRKPVMGHGWTALDTGCGAHPPFILSCVVLPSMETFSVNALTGKVGDGKVQDFDLD